MRWRDSYPGLAERELRLDPVGGQNRLYTEGGRLVALLSLPCLRQIAGLLAARRDSGLKPVLLTVYLAMGSLYDELDYADLGLAYDDQGLAMGGVDPATQGAILERCKAHIERARQGRASARAAGDAALEARYAKALEGDLALALRISEDGELLSEYRLLVAEGQARAGAAGPGP
jgi:hypothetical protein